MSSTARSIFYLSYIHSHVLLNRGYGHGLSSKLCVHDVLLLGTASPMEYFEKFVGVSGKPLFLMELGNVSKFRDDTKDVLRNIQGYFDGAQLVISLSSGNLKFLQVNEDSSFVKVVRSFAEEYNVYFTPYTENEAEKFIQSNSGYNLSLQAYKTLTNFNPKLLSLCSGCEDEFDAKSMVDEYIQLFVQQIAITLDAVQFSWVNDTLPISKEMFFYAANDMEIPMDKVTDYRESWLCSENITYISKVNTAGETCTKAEKFKLGINFPTIYEKLMRMFIKHKAELHIHSDILNGFQFEYSICREMKVLHLTYSKQRLTRFSQPRKDSVTIDISLSVGMNSNEPVKELVNGVLYHLRPNHPVIDAVGYFEKSGGKYLLLIQVSLTDCINHRSKAVDIKKAVRGCERTIVDQGAKNWLEYYCRRIPNTDVSALTCIYVYIGPNDFYTSGDIYSRFLPGTKTTDVFFGLVIGSSLSAKEITRLYRTVVHH